MSSKLTGLWRHPDFLKVWAGETVSLFGSQVSLLAIPLTAVLVLQATPAQIGLLVAAETAPLLLLSLFAGAWLDRVPRRPIMIISDCALALLSGSIVLASFWGILSIVYLYVVSFLVGVFSVLFAVAYQAYLPTLVETEFLLEANSKLETTRALAEISGPAIAGALIQLLTAPIATGVDAVSFLVSGLGLSLVREPEPRLAHSKVQPNIWREIGEGLRELLSNPMLRAFVLCNVITNFFDNIIATLYTLYLVRELGISPALLGIVLGIGGVGGLLGAVLATRISQRLGFGPTLLWANICFGLGSLLVPLAGGPLIWAVPLLIISRFLKSMVNLIYNIGQISVRQAITPHRLQGRVNASMRFLAGGTVPFGALVGGLLGTVIGLRATLLVGATGVCLSTLPIFFSPVRHLQNQPMSKSAQE